MTRWKPCKRRDFIRRLNELGLEGPFSGKRHQFMVYLGHRLAIPSNAEYSIPQLRTMLQEVSAILERSISASDWDSLR